jgi:hypothetical protein
MLIWSIPLIVEIHCHNPVNIFPLQTIDRFMQSRNHQSFVLSNFPKLCQISVFSHNPMINSGCLKLTSTYIFANLFRRKRLSRCAPDALQESVLLCQSIQRIVTLAHSPHESAESICLILSSVSAVLVNLGD